MVETNDYDGMLLEPTPLSESVNQQHLLKQQRLRPEEEFIFEQDSFLYDPVTRRSSKRRRSHEKGTCAVRFSCDAAIHANPRTGDEVASSWYSVS